MKKIHKIGLPVTPAKNVTVEEINTNEILISYGGGMGGANKKYYSTGKKDGKYQVLSGNDIWLNENFIVSKKEVTVLKILTNITEHVNYKKKDKVDKSFLTEFKILPFDCGYELTKDFDKSNLKTIIEYRKDY